MLETNNLYSTEILKKSTLLLFVSFTIIQSFHVGFINSTVNGRVLLCRHFLKKSNIILHDDHTVTLYIKNRIQMKKMLSALEASKCSSRPGLCQIKT